MFKERAAAQADRSTRHPGEGQLERFLRGESDHPERRAVVRHLLTGCRVCVAVTAPIWSLADRPRTHRLDPEDVLHG